jgi:hypothetical protein
MAEGHEHHLGTFSFWVIRRRFEFGRLLIAGTSYCGGVWLAKELTDDEEAGSRQLGALYA